MEKRDWTAGLYLALSRPDGWRVTATPDRWRDKACHVIDQRGGTLPRTYLCRAAMHGAAELFRCALKIGAVKSVIFEEKKQC